jgi:hypothetical protein
MEDLCIVITTCKQYYSNVAGLINQINELKFPKQSILIVSGQEETEEVLCKDGIKIIKVPYTGIHLTGPIYINENLKSFPHIKYWLFLPDTIKFGNNFLCFLQGYYDTYLKAGTLYSLVVVNPILRPTMDMGILHSTHVSNMSDYLGKIKSYNTERDNLIRLKRQLIFDENMFLGLLPHCHYRHTKHNNPILPSGMFEYITNDERDIEAERIENGKLNQVYFALLDLTKYQRNFNGPDVDLVMTL